jgi:hypothetical protein
MVLAAGNVTSATPCTTPATLTTCASRDAIHTRERKSSVLEQQNLAPRAGERVRGGAATGSRPDDDDVVAIGHDQHLSGIFAARALRMAIGRARVVAPDAKKMNDE